MLFYQRLDVVVQRHKYLQWIRQLRNARYTIYYQDKTWCNANYTKEYVWQKEHKEKSLTEDSIWKRGLKMTSRSGKRLIINHLGSSNGFLQDCGECFVEKKIQQITIIIPMLPILKNCSRKRFYLACLINLLRSSIMLITIQG